MYDYGNALVIGSDFKDISTMNIQEVKSQTKIVEDIESLSFDKPATFTVKTTYTGRNADYYRSLLDNFSKRELENDLIDFYSTMYSSLEITENLDIEDNEEKNEIVIKETYTIYDFWTEDASEKDLVYMVYEPMSVYEYVGSISCRSREFDYQISNNIDFNMKTNIKLPREWEVDTDDVDKKTDDYEFTKKTKYTASNKTVSVNYNYKTFSKSISKDDFRDYCQFLNTVSKNMALELYYYNYPKKRGGLSKF